MKIVRPYGASHTRENSGTLRRVLVESTPGRAERDIPDFAASHDELVIAQWISTIDKIARKPAGGKNPTATQRAFRHRLGNACWLRMIANGRLPGATTDRRSYLNDLWWFKIHPYPTGELKPRRKDGKPLPEPPAEGRWYRVFSGDVAPESADVQEIADRVETHLHGHASGSPVCREGLISRRAESIAVNVPVPARSKKDQEWTEEEASAYTRHGDPARSIHAKALAIEEKNKRVHLSDAAAILHAHWAVVFVGEDGSALGTTAAEERHPGMFALHQAIRRCYRLLLKRTRKDTPEHRRTDAKSRRLSQLLPRDLDAALRLVRQQTGNAEIGHIVRLGKIIYYEAAAAGPDSPAAIGKNWPASVENSRFWTSDGQAEIKRSEAFVRIWRHALVLAGLTLKDWVSMKEPFKGDILGGVRYIDRALAPHLFVRELFDRKLELLFGNRAGLLAPGSDRDCLTFLHQLIEATAELRHAIFHFKGRGQLVDALARLSLIIPAEMDSAAIRLWKSDTQDRAGRVKTVLRGSHVEHYLTQEQARRILALLSGDAAKVPLPRFARVLRRADGAWKEGESNGLPEPANRRALEAPARLCQYALLKALYDGPFRSWLADRNAAELGAWIDRAGQRATMAAKDQLNTSGNERGARIITGRMTRLPKPPAGSDLLDFFCDLSAATASEMRVQRGYESDAHNAREQASFIGDLLCDILVLSFNVYLGEQELGWLLGLDPKAPLPERAQSSLDVIDDGANETSVEPWQTALYLLLHLLPVETVGRLLHQLNKWEITATRKARLEEDDARRLKCLTKTLTLYLDMHDAKFEGGHAYVGCGAFDELFESRQGFDRVFPARFDEEAEHRIPRRGLREIRRFGHLPLVRAIAHNVNIPDALIDTVFAQETKPEGEPSPIAAVQERREKLHEKWVNQKGLEKDDLKAYCETVAAVSRHRRDAAFVNLVDHVRTHRLVLEVLGRLVDYAGLFERDVYFVLLALMHREGCRPDQLFPEKGLRLLWNGQIIAALQELDESRDPAAKRVLEALATHFGPVWRRGNTRTDIRNDLAHLNMLQGNAPAPRLTHWVNRTRELVGYDRKLKNAVSQSVIELLGREGMQLQWRVHDDGTAHALGGARLQDNPARHLGKTDLAVRWSTKRQAITEALHGRYFLDMVAVAFEGEAKPPRGLVDDLAAVDWDAPPRSKKGNGDGNARPERPERNVRRKPEDEPQQ